MFTTKNKTNSNTGSKNVLTQNSFKLKFFTLLVAFAFSFSLLAGAGMANGVGADVSIHLDQFYDVYEPTNLVQEVTQGKYAGESFPERVTEQPAIKVSLDGDYKGWVRIAPTNPENSNIQLWAKDSEDNWYDITKTGWGKESTGFPITDAVTPVYPVGKEGTYEVVMKVVAMNGTEEKGTVLASKTKKLSFGIQPAIDAASADDTIKVAAGTYTEEVVIDESLTLLGATLDDDKTDFTLPATLGAYDDTVQSVIKAPGPNNDEDDKDADDNPNTVTITASDVTLKGFVVEALDRGEASGNTYNNLIYLYPGSNEETMTGVTIENNVIGPNTDITSKSNGRHGLRFNAGYGNTIAATITGNKIHGTYGNGNNVFIWGTAFGTTGVPGTDGAHPAANLSGTTIENNDILNSSRSGIELSGAQFGLTIDNNTIHDNGAGHEGEDADLKYGEGIAFVRDYIDVHWNEAETLGTDAGYVDDVTVTNNEIYNNDKNGIYMGPMNKNHIIEGNDIHNNGNSTRDSASTFGSGDGIRIDLNGDYYLTWDWGALYGSTLNIAANSNNIEGNVGYSAQVVGTPSNSFKLDATNNYWGDETGPGGAGPGSGDNVSKNVSYDPWYTSSSMVDMASASDGSEIVIPENNSDSNITVGGSNVYLNFSSNQTNGSVSVTGSEGVNVQIPGNTTISGDNWTGQMKAPESKDEPSVSPEPSEGFTVTTGKTVEVGYSDKRLNFSKAVRILIPGEAGKEVGYSHGDSFYEINTECEYENNQTWANGMSADDCYYSNYSTGDLTVWTKHFTEFVTYEETQIQTEEDTTGGGGSIAVCEEGDWDCTDWSECTDGTQTRDCEKTVSCADMDDLAPAETQSCQVEGEEEAVQECPNCSTPSAWGNCTDGTQTRTNYRCSSETNYECVEYEETQSCQVEEQTGEEGQTEEDQVEETPGGPTGPTGFLVENQGNIMVGLAVLLLLAGAFVYWKRKE